jgi:anti-sigma factor RsiW
MKIAEYIRGELSPYEEREVKHLIDVDPRVRDKYEEWKELFGELALLSQYTYEPDGERWRESISIKAEEERYRKRRLIAGVAIITGVIGGAATAALTYFAIRRK